MSGFPSALRRLALFCLLGSLLGPPLGAEEARVSPGTLLDLQEVKFTPVKAWNQRFREKATADLGAGAEAFGGFAPQKVFKELIQNYLAETVPSMGLTYASVDAHGHPRIYSGRLFLPSHVAGSVPTRLPLVIYQHGTETQRNFTPYYNGGAETMLGALGAEANRFAVAMPDGDGMGADPSPERHAYCHELTTSQCLIDMIRAIEGSGTRIFDGINYVWDGRLFIMGYSEGGYIALAAVKALAMNPAYRDIKLTGAACMGGPFDLAQTTRLLFQDGAAPYTRPYIPAYLLAAWSELYPDDITFREAINPRLLDAVPGEAGGGARGGILQWLDGLRGGDQISQLMQARLTGNKDEPIPARAVVNEAWARIHVDHDRSKVNELLEANSLIEGWAPQVPVLLAHDPYDECVGFLNTQNLFNAWTRQGLHPQEIIEMAVGTHGSGHVGGAVLGVPAAFVWFEAGMPSSMMSMAVNTLRAKALAVAPSSLATAINRAAVLATQEQNVNRAEFPLSRILYHPGGGGEPWTMTLADRFWALGKVKVYTLTPFPQFPGQKPVPGHEYYTKFIKQLKHLGDSCLINPDEPCYFAIYPEKGAVALTLRFSGMGEAPGELNFKQVKNKLFGSGKIRIEGDRAFLRARVHPESFEQAQNPAPFLTLGR